MIDGSPFPAQTEPLPIRCSRARFRMKLPFLDEMEFSEVEGTFLRLEQTLYKGRFPYWSLMLQDESNILNVLFPLTSGLFVRLLRHLIGKKFSYVDIVVRHDEEKRLIVLLDNVQVEPKELTLPPIKKYRTIKNGRKTEWHDYTQRNAAIEKVIAEVNRCNSCV